MAPFRLRARISREVLSDGVLLLDEISRAQARFSMLPVAAVIGGGRPVMSVPSSAAASGTSRGDMMANLRVVAGSDTTAAMVTSEPVPAVVGTAYIGSSLKATRSRP